MKYNKSLYIVTGMIDDLDALFIPNHNVIIEVFSNGAEQGYVLKELNDKGGYQCNLALSKSKSKEDMIVVYFGKCIWFDRKLNTPKEDKDWMRRMFFKDQNKAKQFIFDFMNGKKNVRTGVDL